MLATADAESLITAGSFKGFADNVGQMMLAALGRHFSATVLPPIHRACTHLEHGGR